MQRALDACAVVLTEVADPRHHVFDVALRDFALAQYDLPPREPRLRQTTEVHDDFEQLVLVGAHSNRVADVGSERIEQQIEIVRDRSAQDRLKLQLLALPPRVSFSVPLSA